MQFVIYRDNGGMFHWRLVGENGTALAVSAGIFHSADDAQRAAADVHDHAATATTGNA
jgi:uncharacterized protein YegP (UPF0339 family)